MMTPAQRLRSGSCL